MYPIPFKSSNVSFVKGPSLEPGYVSCGYGVWVPVRTSSSNRTRTTLMSFKVKEVSTVTKWRRVHDLYENFSNFYGTLSVWRCELISLTHTQGKNLAPSRTNFSRTFFTHFRISTEVVLVVLRKNLGSYTRNNYKVRSIVSWFLSNSRKGTVDDEHIDHDNYY